MAPTAAMKNCNQPTSSKHKGALNWGMKCEEKFSKYNRILFSFFDEKNCKLLDLTLCYHEQMLTGSSLGLWMGQGPDTIGSGGDWGKLDGTVQSKQQGLLISGSTVASEGNLDTVLSDLLIFPEKIRYFYVKLPKF